MMIRITRSLYPFRYQQFVFHQSVRNQIASNNNSSNPSMKKTDSSTTLQYRLIRPEEFTNEFEDFVFRRFIIEEPMGKHLGIIKSDPCIMLFIRQILQRAKEDNVSLGFYDLSKNQQYSGKSHRTNFPVCFIINHIENIDDPPEKNEFMMDLSKAPDDYKSKYQAIGDILTKIVEDFDLFKEYKARRIMQSYLAGIEPDYANQGLFTRLKIATIDLARANKCDLIYSKATSRFSTRANLKLGFHEARTINYSTYENTQGQRLFTGMSKTHQACTLTVKDLRN